MESKKTPLQLKMDQLGKHLSIFSFAVIGVIFLIGAVQGHPLIQVLLDLSTSSPYIHVLFNTLPLFLLSRPLFFFIFFFSFFSFFSADVQRGCKFGCRGYPRRYFIILSCVLILTQIRTSNCGNCHFGIGGDENVKTKCNCEEVVCRGGPRFCGCDLCRQNRYIIFI